MPRPPRTPGPPPCLLVVGQRPRIRELARGVMPRRRGRVLAARSTADMLERIKTELVDAVLLDLSTHEEEPWRAAAQAPSFPSIPFFGVLPLRASEGPALAHCVSLELADVIVEGVDEPVSASILGPHMFGARFFRALHDPPPALALESQMQRAAWRAIVSHAGRPVRTSDLAAALGITREHLSRTFATGGAPNLKRVIDLVRLLAAAELAKNPGYDMQDVGRILGFASTSHLSSCAQRLIGGRSVSLARLRAVDLVDRFAQGRGRSRV